MEREDENVEYGWRAKIGLVKPSSNGKSFAFSYLTAPQGVDVVPSHVDFRHTDRQQFLDGIENEEALVRDLHGRGCDLVLVSGTPPWLLKGLEFERAWRHRLEDELGIPVVTPMEPHALALTALGVKRVAVATYYRQELNEAIVRYLKEFGIECIVLPELEGRGDAQLYTRSMTTLQELSFADVYKYCRRGVLQVAPDVDGVYINGGAWDAAPAIQLLEDDLELSVVYAQAAVTWYAYRRLRIRNARDGFGRLLREWPPLPADAT